MDYALRLVEGEASAFDAGGAGRSLARLLAALEALGASPEQHWLVAYNSLDALHAELDPDGASAAIEHALRREGLPPRLRAWLSMERARSLIARQRLAEAANDLDASRAELVETPLVLAALDPQDDGAAPDPATKEALEVAAAWHAARAELDMLLGRVAAAAIPLERARRLAERCGSPTARWQAAELAIRLALSLQLHDEVPPLAAQARASGLLDELGPRAARQLELREAVARHELRRRLDIGACEELSALESFLTPAAVAEDPDLAVAAARLAAALQAECGDLARLDAALAVLAAHAPRSPGGACGLAEAELAAIELQRELLRGDGAAARRALGALEACMPGFLDEWERVARLSSSIALLQFAPRERVLSTLCAGLVAVEGEELGARRSLEWLHRAQHIGGLARGLGLERSKADLALDLAVLAGGTRAVLVLQSGRVATQVHLADGRGVRLHLLPHGEKLRELSGRFGNAAAAATRAEADIDDPSVAALVDELGRSPGVAGLVAELAVHDEVLVVGDESVGHLPLGLLREASGRRLGDRAALGFAPSLPIAAALARRGLARGASKATLRVVGAPESPEPIALERGRFERWSALFDGGMELRLGAEAGLEALRAADVAVLHVVAHGAHDARRECRAGFLLQGPDRESAAAWSDAIESRPAARVTNLVVCGSALRPLLRGDDGRAGLAASFLLAGGDCVLQTSVDLEARAAVDLAELCSVELAAGSTPASALRDARAALARREGRERLQHHLVLAHGAPHVAVLPSSPATRERAAARADAGGRATWAWSLAALALAGALAWWTRKKRA
ncbi:MAG: hypothetical protein RL112_1296 [Planctomycetota bacterium]